jgi:hypothetical protein
MCRFSVTSILQGVGLPYLYWLRSTLGASLGRMTTSQFCQMYVRPFMSRNRGSMTERLMARDETAQHVGEATWFSATRGATHLPTRLMPYCFLSKVVQTLRVPRCGLM